MIILYSRTTPILYVDNRIPSLHPAVMSSVNPWDEMGSSHSLPERVLLMPQEMSVGILRPWLRCPPGQPPSRSRRCRLAMLAIEEAWWALLIYPSLYTKPIPTSMYCGRRFWQRVQIFTRMARSCPWTFSAASWARDGSQLWVGRYICVPKTTSPVLKIRTLE